MRCERENMTGKDSVEDNCGAKDRNRLTEIIYLVSLNKRLLDFRDSLAWTEIYLQLSFPEL